MTDVLTANIKVTRFKGETWSVTIKYPDGSTEQRRGLVDVGHAADVVWEMLRNVDRSAYPALQAGAVTPDGGRQPEVGPPSVSNPGNLGAGPQ